MRTSFLNNYLNGKKNKSLSLYENPNVSSKPASKNLDYFLDMLQEKQQVYQNSKNSSSFSKIFQNDKKNSNENSRSFLILDQKPQKLHFENYKKKEDSPFSLLCREPSYPSNLLATFFNDKKKEETRKNIMKKSEQIFKIAGYDYPKNNKNNETSDIFLTTRENSVNENSFRYMKDLSFFAKHSKNPQENDFISSFPLKREKKIERHVLDNNNKEKKENQWNNSSNISLQKSTIFSRINELSLCPNQKKNTFNRKNDENNIETTRNDYLTISNAKNEEKNEKNEKTAKKLFQIKENSHKINVSTGNIKRFCSIIDSFYSCKVRMSKRISFKMMTNWFYQIKYQEKEKILTYFRFIFLKIRKKHIAFSFLKLKLFQKPQKNVPLLKKKIAHIFKIIHKYMKKQEREFFYAYSNTPKNIFFKRKSQNYQYLINYGKEILFASSPCFQGSQILEEKPINNFENKKTKNAPNLEISFEENQEKFKVQEISFADKENLSFCEDAKQKTVKKSTKNKKTKSLFQAFEKNIIVSNSDSLKKKISERFILEGNMNAFKRITNL